MDGAGLPTSEAHAGGRLRRVQLSRPRIGLSIALLSLLAAAVAVAVAIRERDVRKSWLDRLSLMAGRREDAIHEFVEDCLSDTALISRFPTVVKLLAPGGNGTRSAEVEHITSVIGSAHDLWRDETFSLLDPGSTEVTRVGEPLRPEILQVLRGWRKEKPFIGIVNTSAGSRVVFAVPVNGGGGLVRVDNPEHRLWPILRQGMTESSTGESLLSEVREGRLYFLSPLKAPVKEGLESLSYGTLSLPAFQAAAGAENQGEFTDYRGQRVLAAFRHVDGTGWGLVVKIDKREALAELWLARFLAGVTFAALAVALWALLRAYSAAERARAEDALRRRDERHRLVLEQVRDAVVWVRPEDGRLLEANLAAENLWGYSREELLGMKVMDFRPPGDDETVREQLKTALETGIRFQAHHRKQDGSFVPVEVSSRAVVLDTGKVLISVVRDVSEREAARKEILLLNRLLRTIGAVNRLLATETDKSRMLSRVCQTIVDEGGFVMAWVGVFEEGGGRVSPVATGGRVEGYFEDIEIRVNDSSYAQSPVVVAMREDRVASVGDWENDPQIAPWREAGLKRGYRSSAACPVHVESQRHGVLALYAAEPGVFVPEVIKLLEELASSAGLAFELIKIAREQHEAAERMQASETRHRLLFQANPLPMWVFDVETLRFLDVNEAAVSGYGYTRDEFLSMTILDIRPEEDVPAVVDIVAKKTPGVHRAGTWRHRRKDGTFLEAEITSHDVPFEGRSARLVLVSDVTEKRRMEQKLRAFFDSGMMGAIFGDIYGRVLAANDEYLRIIGYSREDLDSGLLKWSDITPPEWLPVDEEHISEARNLGACTPYEKEYIRKDGSRVWVLVGYALLGPLREESVAFILDLTEMKESEARLEATTRLLQAIFNESPTPIVTLAPDGSVTSWSPAAERVFGWKASDVMGRMLPIVQEERTGEFQQLLNGVLSGQAITGREIRRKCKDGSHIDLSLAAAPLWDADGEVEGVAALLLDITERKKAEEEVHRLNIELEKRVEERTAELLSKTKELEGFAYSVSHDLRAPLRAIDGFSRILEEDYVSSLDTEGQRLLGVVRTNARRMGQLIDDLLDFSRAGRHALKKSSVNVETLVRDILDETVPKHEQSKTELVVRDLPPVEADPALLRQVFVNLISNAIKFSAERNPRVVEIWGSRDEHSVSYNVKDNGVGFDMAYADKLFGVFQRLHGREFEGTGVGLALVERIISKHRGTVKAMAELGKGATFTISLPSSGGRE